ncbi:hypothetical protein B0H14DRAFT_3154834 [Mycena olivaceomarginata]|nr:hypothetical protein B0H14DRAFT_3154834 [Mycena olivaceomarginata]
MTTPKTNSQKRRQLIFVLLLTATAWSLDDERKTTSAPMLYLEPHRRRPLAFAKAAGFLDPTFPFLRNLKDPGNIMFITIALHSGLESECVAVHLPLARGILSAPSPFINSMALIAPTLELHYWSGALPPTKKPRSKRPQRGQMDTYTFKRVLIIDDLANLVLQFLRRLPSRNSSAGQYHHCDLRPDFGSWYTRGHPYLAGAADYPHPFLPKLHYGVFLAQNFASKALQRIALGGEKRKRKRGKREGEEEDFDDESDSDRQDDDEDDTDEDAEHAQKHLAWPSEENDDGQDDDDDDDTDIDEDAEHAQRRVDWFHYLMEQVVRRANLVHPERVIELEVLG